MDCTNYVTPLCIMSVFVLLDIITGLVGAYAGSGFSSTKMREGLFHKSAFYGAFALAVALEVSSEYMDLGITVPAVNVITGYIVLTEVVSILENLCVINPELKNNKFLGMFGQN